MPKWTYIIFNRYSSFLPTHKPAGGRSSPVPLVWFFEGMFTNIIIQGFSKPKPAEFVQQPFPIFGVHHLDRNVDTVSGE